MDASFGGGYRCMLGDKTLVGVNGFYDSTRLAGTWYASGGIGVEMAAELPGNDAVDFNFNWYGNQFTRSVILNAFRTGPTSYDFQAGYSHELWNGGPDFRLSATGYRFDVGAPVWGWNAGAELKSRDGMLVLRYQVGNDRLNQTYQTVGAYVNVGLRLENLARGESPFTMPEPIFKSPRNLWTWLNRSLSTTRSFHQPAAVIMARQNGATAPTTAPTTAPFVQFRITVLPPPLGGTAAPTTLTGSGTMTLSVANVNYTRWQLDFVGDTSALPDPVPVTVSTVTTGFTNVWLNVNDETLVLNFPRAGGGTVGAGGTLLNIAVRPIWFTLGPGTPAGTATFSAAGVQTMVVLVTQ